MGKEICPMNILAWIILGGLAGWVATLITGDNGRVAALGNIALGIVGAFLGGFIARTLGSGGITGFNLGSFLIALAGSVFILLLASMFRTREM
jgi:uncharacterized membrane protein YeaQ/YmgE (transglycosylase-associated protein family)